MENCTLNGKLYTCIPQYTLSGTNPFFSGDVGPRSAVRALPAMHVIGRDSHVSAHRDKRYRLPGALDEAQMRLHGLGAGRGCGHAIAGLTNSAGNVLAIMPHPERGAWFHQVPRHVGGKWGRGRDFVERGDLFAPGPGLGVFTSLKRALS